MGHSKQQPFQPRYLDSNLAKAGPGEQKNGENLLQVYSWVILRVVIDTDQIRVLKLYELHTSEDLKQSIDLFKWENLIIYILY